MPKRRTNNLKWKAELMRITNGKDDKNRPLEIREKIRTLFYADLGIAAQEKFLSQQAKTDVVRRLVIRWDKSINEKTNGIRIDGIDYNITRIFTNMEKREMELSLIYVN